LVSLYPRDAMHMRVICCRKDEMCLSVCPSVCSSQSHIV